MKTRKRKLAWAVGTRVRARSSGWLATVIAHNKQNSSPYKVRWDKNGLTSNVNFMSVEEA